MIRRGLATFLFGLLLATAAGGSFASASGVVISQVYGGGGATSSTPTYRNDYVELFNGGAAPVSLNGWSVQYASSGGSSWSVTNLPNVTLQPGQYFLVQQGGGTLGGALPTPDATGTSALSANAGKVALVSAQAALSGTCPTAGVVDFVGYGGVANCFEGAGPTPNLSNTTAAVRALAGCTDADSNTADFAISTPSPRNTSTPLAPCTPGNLPIAAVCTAFNTVQGIAGSSLVTASDPDSIVNGVSFAGTPPAGFTLGTLAAAGADGETASVRIEVGAGVATGTYTPQVTFSNNESQSTTCTLSVTVVAPPAAITPTYAIQGSGATSPLVGQVRTTRGVVTAVFPGLRGFFIQDEAGDGDASTSDGLFVFMGSTPITVAVGERVQATGSVVEFAGFSGDPTITEIGSVTQLAKLGVGTIAPTPIALPETTEGELERYEGMLVTIAGPLTVSQNFFQGRYGQVTLSANGRLIKPTNVYRPNTPQAVALADENARRRIVLDDGQASESFFSGVENPNPVPYIGADDTLRAGDTLASLTGIIDFGRITSATGAAAIVDYKIHPTLPPVFSRVNSRTATPPSAGGTLTVASFNVLNYFTTFGDGGTASGQSGQGCLPGGTTGDCRGADNLAEFVRQRDKIVRAIAALNADVVGLMEIQRNGGIATQNLVDALNAFLGTTAYAVVPDPANVGTDAIQVAMIYKPAAVALVGGALSDAAAVHNRPPVAQAFRSTATNEKFSVIVNHFKSKNCDGAAGLDLDQGDGQGCFNDRRKQQASALLSFVATVQAAAGDDDVLIIGDLNAYAQEDPVDLLVAGGFGDQVLRFNGPSAYSYVFDGEAGYLDHALASPSLAAQIAGTAIWRINADEPSVIDYNTEFKSQDLYAVSPYRSSDHDPVLVGLLLAPPRQPQSITFDPLPDRQLSSGGFGVAAIASSGLPVGFTVPVTTSVCTVSGTTVSLVATGTCTIAADQPGDASFLPAPQVTRSFNVLAGLLPQTITFAPLADRTLGDPPFAVAATATSGLAVSFGSLTLGTCAVSGNTVTLIGAGTCTIAADQAGNALYAAASQVAQSFQVAPSGGPSAQVPLPLWAHALTLLLIAGAGARLARVAQSFHPGSRSRSHSRGL